jgi:hypothetical protein
MNPSYKKLALFAATTTRIPELRDDRRSLFVAS